MSRYSRRTIALVGGLLLLAGCGRGAEAVGRLAPGEGVPITVQHNLVGAPTVVIQIVAPVTPPRLLGTVVSGSSETFYIPEGTLSPGEYRLLAEAPDGRRLDSGRFILTDDGVTWSLVTNSVRPGGQVLEPADQR